MSRTNKGSKAPGFEYWGKRAFIYVFGKGWKRLTNRAERAQHEQSLVKELKSMREDDR